MTVKNENMRYWDQFADIDPKFTKAITGKSYKGTSPNPQYVIQCLTDMFGPVGQGFGWDVVAEAFTELGGETLHWCRIKFWHTDRTNTFDSYGQTKACYTTNSGKIMVDEDAPKKSLTDAIIKAASHIGIAANIFLGRWGDQKYVAQVDAEYRGAEKHDQAAIHESAVANAVKHIGRETSQESLTEYWGNIDRTDRATARDPRVIEAAKKRKADLQLADAADSIANPLANDAQQQERRAN
jgi:hypothetical protein